MAVGGVQLDFGNASLTDYSAAKQPKRNLFISGLSSGVDELQALGGSAIAATGAVMGVDPIRDLGNRVAASNALEAQQNGRPDLEIAPWKEGGADLLHWLPYQTMKQIPQLAGYIGAGLLTPEAAVPAAFARFGATVPRIIGGGGLKAGAEFAVKREAVDQGRKFAARVIGGEIAGIPLAQGSMYQEAGQKPGGADVTDALKATALSPLYAALDSLDVPFLSGLGKMKGPLLKRVAMAGLVGAAEEVPQEGVQTAMEQSFRPDLTPKQKMANIVDAAITGGAVGGVLGGFAGVRKLKNADAASIQGEDIDAAVDAALNGQTGTEHAPQGEFDLQPQAKSFPPGYQPDMFGNGDTYDALDAAKRPFKELEDKDLMAAAKKVTPDTDPEVLRGLQAEFIARGVQSPLSEPGVGEVVGAGPSDLTGGGADTASSVPTTRQNFQDTVTDLVRQTGKTAFLSKLEATDENDLFDKVHEQVIVNGSTSKREAEYAKRVGVLDEDGKPSALSNQLSEAKAAARQEAAPAVEPTLPITPTEQAAPANQEGGEQSFAKEWNAIRKDKQFRQSDEVKALNPTSGADLDRKVYNALATSTEETTDKKGVSNMERVAQIRGILNDKLVLTEKGQDIAARDPIDTSVASKAAVAQGFAGQQKAMFTRGVNGHLADVAYPKFKSPEHAAAYTAGRNWADEHNSVPKGALRAYAPQREVSDEQLLAAAGVPINTVKSAGVPPEQQRQQTLNTVLDAMSLNPSVKPTEVAALKSMIAQGRPDGEVLEAIKAVGQGQGLLPIDLSPEKPRYRGEVATRGAPRDPDLKIDLANARLVRRKGDRKAEDAQAIRAFELRKEIEASYRSGDITGKERIELVFHLMNNKFQTVADLLPGGRLREKMDISRRDFLGAVAATAVSVTGAPRIARAASHPVTGDLQSLVAKGDVAAILAHLKDHASTGIYRLIANKLSKGAGWDQVDISWSPVEMTALGVTTLNDDGTTSIELYGKEGLAEETLLHEMIHAYVQRRWGSLTLYNEHNKEVLKDTTERHDIVIENFNMLWDQISNALEKTMPRLVETVPWVNQVHGSPSEALSWIMTDPDAQAYLRTVDMSGKKIPVGEKSLWDSIVEFFRNVFGLPPAKAVQTALDQLLNAGQSILDAGRDVKTGDFSVKLAKQIAAQANDATDFMLKSVGRTPTGNRAVDEYQLREFQTAAPPKSPVAINAQTRKVVGAVNAAAKRLRESTSLGSKLLKNMIGWMPFTHINEKYKAIFPEVELLLDAHSDRRATSAVFSQLYEEPNYAADQLAKNKPEQAKRMSEIMELTAYDIDPTRTWAENTHLHNADNAAELERLHAIGHRKYNLLRADGSSKVYDDLRRINEVSQLSGMAMGVYHLVANDPEFAQTFNGFETDPMIEFRNNANLHTAVEARKYWNEVLQREVDQIRQQTGELRGDAASSMSKAEAGRLGVRLTPLETYVQEVKSALTGMENSPYFHLGRFGEHYISFSVRLKADGTGDKDAVEHVAKVLDKKLGITNARISKEAGKANVYLRVEKESTRDSVFEGVKELEKQGWLSDNPNHAPKRGPRTDGMMLSERSATEMKKMINAVKASPIFDVTENMSEEEAETTIRNRDRVIAEIYNVWLDMLPDTAQSKVMTHREGTPGYDKDMMRSFAFRYQIATNSIANLSAAPYIDNAFTQMRDRVNKAKEDPKQDVDAINTIFRELAKRETIRADSEGEDWSDNVRALNHAFFLGMSPSYMLVNLTQMGVLLWPELAKRHGFVGAAKAIAKVTPMAFRIMKAAFDQGKAAGWKRAADATITAEVLKKAKVPAQTAEFLMRMLGSGIIDIGGAARELGRVSAGTANSKLDATLRYAAAAGLYSETFTRLVAALSARDVHKGDNDSAAEYSKDVVRASMLEYSTWNVARHMGKGGMFGKFGPIMFSFLQYSTQVTWKLYRELNSAFLDRASTDEQKKEARKFLAAHMTAVMTLAGTLGMPFASVIAMAIEKLVDTFDDDDEPYDATSAWRNFLAEIMGPELAEMASRGLPRGMGEGFDLSQRAGEQNLLPFTNFLTDQRRWQDASKEMALRAMGAPASMAMSLPKGMEKIGDGDILAGMKEMVPVAIKGPLEAFRMSQEGYVDNQGNKLPLSVGAAAILGQALGFTPATKAEYSEARADQAARRGEITRHASTLRRHLVDAILDGDQGEQRDVMQQVIKFDRDNPAYGILRSLDSAISRRAAARQTSTITQTPLGVSARDLEGQDMTRYANIHYGR